ncbi:glutathione peroxidase [Gammaproteobacteria bacterium]|jgi:glutathione peroxidase|nr:glutathione peroxidase [Gammaproteobacteria bacterium]MDA9973886.1 glutathione peroxidase [Gammaproteobacteria bacterium]MDB9700454.1 glutathione peroxidase [Gammaproteobacteria bacterium]MDB9896266.1 glutathione peroxidase [Gammaproteobacteria bacterium]MDC0091802.1 glutathione peroxidase [Gammaproteobacteria bacterium]|tara:strand:+ start:534 stop:1013 length:480 start_codon:yes stop_codon:yes gene_type:complete
MSDLYTLSVKDINLDSVDLSTYKGKTLLIVNVASKCGFTPQYKDLQRLSDKYKDQGLEVLGFPCNQFGGQEPGTNEEVQSFCDLTFNVSFKLFDKIDVNGSNASPLFKYLKHESPGILGTEAIKWNFTKFLVDQNGVVIKRFAPKDGGSAIEAELIKII